MPYVKKNIFGVSILRGVQLSQNLGPWLRPSNSNYSKKLSQEKEFIQALFSKLPNFSHYQQSWHYDRTNWLPLYWQGYEQTTAYTYIIHLSLGLDDVWSKIHASYRNKIRKAEKIVKVKFDLPIEGFFKINKMTFDRQGLDIPYSLKFLKKHHEIIKSKKSCQIFYAEDTDGKIHSALYLTWDDRSSYVHMVGEDPDLRNSGAGILLIWEAVKFTAEILNLNYLDFEGSMIESVERVRRDFGSIQTPYFIISKSNSKLVKTSLFLRSLK